MKSVFDQKHSQLPGLGKASCVLVCALVLSSALNLASERMPNNVCLSYEQRCLVCRSSNRRLSQQAAGVRTNGAQSGVLKLILYSKPECHLCHGLKVSKCCDTTGLLACDLAQSGRCTSQAIQAAVVPKLLLTSAVRSSLAIVQPLDASSASDWSFTISG